ncbi:MAG TPA: ABC transporter ATP-binding protein [Gemmataceae bacterium]
MTTAVLEVEGLGKSYGRLRALDGVTLRVEAGEMFGLLGPNGAGKTTLISILAGLLDPDAGGVRLFGKPLRRSDPAVRREIGLGTQDLAVYGELTARENLRFFGKLYGLSGAGLHSRVEEVLEAVGLRERAGDRVSTFSGGMKRRLNLGVAVVHRPRLLFLDEPTTGVDPQSRNRIFEQVLALNKQGMTVIYSSHYMEEVQALCRRVAILDHGRLIACDELPALLRLLEGRVRVRAAGLPPGFVERVAALPGVRAERAGAGTLELYAEDAPRALLRVVEVARELNVELTGLGAEEPNLERVFLHLTGHALRD